MTPDKPLGRWHKWWLKQFKDAWDKKGGPSRHTGGIAVQGYEGTAQGRALVGLLDRGLIAYNMGFEGGIDSLTITEKGLAA